MAGCGRKRSAAAFETFYVDHEAELYRYLARRLDAHAAEAVVAECFALAWDGFATRDRSIGGRAWLFGFALERLRSRRRDELAHLDRIARSDVELVADSACAQVAAALAQLDAVDRDMLTLHVWAGVSHDTVAWLTGLPAVIVERRVAGAYDFVQSRAAPD
jgi:RNA polymerase sigma-70 factor (ECF subfamily)